MTECKLHTYETALELIEQMIEGIDPDETVNVSDITGRIKLADPLNDITQTTIMLLKKYGIEYREETDGRSNRCPAKRGSADDVRRKL